MELDYVFFFLLNATDIFQVISRCHHLYLKKINSYEILFNLWFLSLLI